MTQPQHSTKAPGNGAPTPAAELWEILERRPSPFSDAVLQNAFRDTPDVPEIQGRVRARLTSLIAGCRQNGSTSIQVITGDPGEGKTHLLAWLRRASEQSWRTREPQQFALAPVAPLRSADRPFHHVLQEAVWSLKRSTLPALEPGAAPVSSLEHFLWRVLLGIAQRLADQQWLAPSLRNRLRPLVEDLPPGYLTVFASEAAATWEEIDVPFGDAAQRLPELAAVDPEVLRVLVRFPREDLRPDILEWLAGASIPAERRELLGSRLELDEEDGAGRALQALLHLGQVAGVPLVLAFDQIEGTERLGEDAVGGFLGALGEIYNGGGAALLLVFCQTQIWPSLRKCAQLQVQDRLRDNPEMHLEALTPEQGLLLVQRRLAHFWAGSGARPPTPSWPLTRDFVLEQVQAPNLRTPRKVLQHFHRLLLEPQEVETLLASAQASTTQPVHRPEHPASGQGARAPSAQGQEVGSSPHASQREPMPSAGTNAPRTPRRRAPPREPTPEETVRKTVRRLLEEERRAPPRAPAARADIARGVLREMLRARAESGRPARDIRIAGVEEYSARRRAAASGTRVSLRRNDEVRRVYMEASNSTHGGSVAAAAKRLKKTLEEGEADQAVLLREEAFPLPRRAREILAELTPRGAVIWLREHEVAPLAALEGLLNAAAAGDIPVSEKQARGLAVDLFAGELDALDRVLAAAWPSFVLQKTTPEATLAATAAPPEDEGTQPASAIEDPVARRIVAYLARNCAMVPVPSIGDRLELEIDAVHSAIDSLRSAGLIEVVEDRRHVPVALLHPDALGQLETGAWSAAELTETPA